MYGFLLLFPFVSTESLIMNGQYVIFFITETSIYSFYDRFDHPPMRRIHPEELICQSDSYENALMIVNALNEYGEI